MTNIKERFNQILNTSRMGKLK